MCLSHHLSDRVCYVEFDGQELKVLPTAPAVISANHRLMRTFASEIPAASQHRLNRLRDLLGGDPPRDVTSERAQQVLRDRFDPSRGREVPSSNINTLRRVDNQISIIFEPGRGNLWVTAGPSSNGHQNEFCELKLSELLPELATNPAEPTEPQNFFKRQPPAEFRQHDFPRGIARFLQASGDGPGRSANRLPAVCAADGGNRTASRQSKLPNPRRRGDRGRQSRLGGDSGKTAIPRRAGDDFVGKGIRRERCWRSWRAFGKPRRRRI